MPWWAYKTRDYTTSSTIILPFYKFWSMCSTMISTSGYDNGDVLVLYV
uniref:Uncharacterized protein n=1 Tax=Arundo donax TaxID=35708 RepID=A0A0A9FMX5_ARUDO